MVREAAKRNAVLGVESSGHYVVWRNLNMDDGLLTMLYFAEAASRLGRVSDAVPQAYPVVRVKVPAPDEVKFEVVSKLAEELAASYRVETIDGVKLWMEEGWVLARPSNTEPVVRVTSEAHSLEAARRLAESMVEEVKRVLAELSS